MSNPFLPHILKIGPKLIHVADLADASSAYQIERDQSGEGSNRFPEGRVAIGSEHYRISYNGRVWKGGTVVLEAQ